MKLFQVLYLLALTGPGIAARWNRRQDSVNSAGQSCTCPTDALKTSTIVQFTTVTSSTTTTSVVGTTTSLAPASVSTTTITESGTTFAKRGRDFTDAHETAITSDPSRKSLSAAATSSMSSITSLFHPKLAPRADSTAPSTITFTSSIAQSGTSRPLTCVCRRISTASSLLSSSSESCSCPATTTSVSTFLTATNFITYISSSYITVVSTPTSIVTATVTPSASSVYCNSPTSTGTIQAGTGNQGLAYTVYDNPIYPNTLAGPSDGNNGYPTYNVTYWDNRMPDFIGQTEFLGFPASPNVDGDHQYYPDMPGRNVTQTTIIHQGFVYARITGTYTFSFISTDDIGLLWTGDKAYSGYTRANADVLQTFMTGTQAVHTFRTVLSAGSYLPIRLQWSNAQQGGRLIVSITNPVGTVLSNSTTSTDIVTYPCGGTARQFPAPPTPLYCDPSTASPPQPSSNADVPSNRGLQYGVFRSSVFNNPPYPADQTSGFPNYNPTIYDNTVPLQQGVTALVGVNTTVGGANTPVQIYGGSQRINIANITIVHRGFLYARAAGTYTFTSEKTDDITLLWVGNTAISGFTRSNANIVHTFANTATPRSYRVTLTQGRYLPVRIQWANGGPPGGFSFSVTGPDGTFLLNPEVPSDQIVSGACDGSTPTLPAWPTS